jgi:hypothetical protein
MKITVSLDEGECEKIEIKFNCCSSRPNGERDPGVRGIAVLRQRALVYTHLESFFGLSSDLDAACTAPLTPSPP